MPVKKSVAAKAKENPMVAWLIVLGTIGTAMVGISKGIDVSDQYVVTHAELELHESQIHPAASKIISEIELKSECRWLDDKIDRLDDLLYQLRRDSADPARIHDKEKDLQKYRNQYQAKRCATVKY